MLQASAAIEQGGQYNSHQVLYTGVFAWAIGITPRGWVLLVWQGVTSYAGEYDDVRMRRASRITGRRWLLLTKGQ